MATYLKQPTATGRADTRLDGVRETVTAVIGDVPRHGDAAVRRYSESFDSCGN